MLERNCIGFSVSNSSVYVSGGIAKCSHYSKVGANQGFPELKSIGVKKLIHTNGAQSVLIGILIVDVYVIHQKIEHLD